MTTTTIETAQQFFERLFGDAVSQERRLVVYDLNAFSTLAASLEEAAAAVQEIERGGGRRAAFFGTALQPLAARGGGRGRGTVQSAAAIGGVWVDVDAGKRLSGKAYPPNLDEAFGAVRVAVPLPWSCTVQTSSTGAHLYWLLREPWLFEGKEDRERAQRLVQGFQSRIRAAFDARGGWALDSTHDLARMLRAPGSINYKVGEGLDPCGQRVTAQYRCDPNGEPVRYNPAELEEWADPVESSAPVNGNAAKLNGTCEPRMGVEVLRPQKPPRFELKLQELCDFDATPRALWGGDRRVLLGGDTSDSGVDHALAISAAKMSWNDEEIVFLIQSYWAKHGPRDKPSKLARRDYLQRTIDHARRSVRVSAGVQDAVAAAQEDSGDEPGELGAPSTIDALPGEGSEADPDQTHEEEGDGQEEDEGEALRKKKALGSLRKRLGLHGKAPRATLVNVRKVGKRGGLFYFDFEISGKVESVELGTTVQIQSKRHVDGKISDVVYGYTPQTGEIVAPWTLKIFPLITQAAGEGVEIHDSPEEELKGWLAEAISTRKPSIYDIANARGDAERGALDLLEHLRLGAAAVFWTSDRRLGVHLLSFLQFLRLELGVPLQQGSLQRRLANLNFRSKLLSARDPEAKKVVGKRVWIGPMGWEPVA